ncbi:hypothetical protein VTK73DRAFT_9211 [Phialemonium thermophilum]|uniref:NADP-dependent oxidoreductase domain-containing protein n=1 Tax=Phialemonium thermophilum TaxID=223376 RepID=A0ABR3W3V9_9PEZI
MPVKKVPLGKNGPLVPAMGLGLMGMSVPSYGAFPGDEERFAILDRALELGSTFWDSSDLYGDSEELIGKWFKRTGKRDQIFLATKWGFTNGFTNVDSSAAHCKEACAASLKRLGVDTIDLYYLHAANPQTPIEESVRAMAELKAEGKIRYLGVSNISSASLRRACKVAPISAIQIEYSLFVREIEGPEGTNLLATARELGVAVVAYSPLGRGVLTATFGSGQPLGEGSDMRPQVMPFFMGENRAKNERVVRQLQTWADKKGCSVTQLAIAWLLKQGDDVIPIPGTKKIKYLEENWAALDVALTDQEEREIRAFIESSEIAGSGKPAQFADGYYVDTKEESS